MNKVFKRFVSCLKKKLKNVKREKVRMEKIYKISYLFELPPSQRLEGTEYQTIYVFNYIPQLVPIIGKLESKIH